MLPEDVDRRAVIEPPAGAKWTLVDHESHYNAPVMTDTPGAYRPPARILLGPGPSSVDPRVLTSMSHPLLGHLDPDFLHLMDDISRMSRTLFGTSNEMTLAVPGTGTSAMEAAMVNLLEPSDRALICVAGYFGARMAEMARRVGAQVTTLESTWGTPVEAEAVEKALRSTPGGFKIVGMVQAETSTGVLQPIDEIIRMAREHGALTVVDAVTSLGGMPVQVDAAGSGAGIDLCYSGTQKCIGAPPGLAPLTAGPRAVEAMRRRKLPCASFYLDLLLLSDYWAGPRGYHHTAPISTVYALREALRLVMEEGLEARFARHRKVHEQLARGIEGLGLEFLVEPRFRLPMLNTIRIPEGAADAPVRRRLLTEHNLEIGGGLGTLAGKVWRVGLMGYSARDENVARFLTAMRIILGAPRMSRPPRRRS